ncbi:hypothetical protein E1B28_009513 [Marasmius oreades]|uniref:Uncharacterized protein n=1 Tax=Marasmius oreades TaxID=181124 RepID=A0A9P7USP7_9AGAR|nr:uncharacterized protein E1B28_009513 [Marasmius oreades]KAG7090394.1 hypothetical protein E1B28_009513 [Marasmius oreades]
MSSAAVASGLVSTSARRTTPSSRSHSHLRSDGRTTATDPDAKRKREMRTRGADVNCNGDAAFKTGKHSRSSKSTTALTQTPPTIPSPTSFRFQSTKTDTRTQLIHREKFPTASSTNATDTDNGQFRRDTETPTYSGDPRIIQIQSSPSYQHVAKTLTLTSAKNDEAMPGTLNTETRRRSPSFPVPSLYTYGVHAQGFTSPISTLGCATPIPPKEDEMNFHFLTNTNTTTRNHSGGEEGKSRRQKEKESSVRGWSGLRKSASDANFTPQPSSSSPKPPVRPSTSPSIYPLASTATTTAVGAVSKSKIPFITIKWLTKRRYGDRKEAESQGLTIPHPHQRLLPHPIPVSTSETKTNTWKVPHPPSPPPSSTYEEFELTTVARTLPRPRSRRRSKSIIQENSTTTRQTRVSLIIDHVEDMSDSEEDPMVPATPPPPPPPPPALPSLPKGSGGASDKVQRLFPYDSRHLPHSASRHMGVGKRPRPRLHLNLTFARPSSQAQFPHRNRCDSHSPATPTYDEKDGWCIDDRYLAGGSSSGGGNEYHDGGGDGKEEEEDDDGGGITPVSDIVFGERPSTPTPTATSKPPLMKKEGEEGSVLSSAGASSSAKTLNSSSSTSSPRSGSSSRFRALPTPPPSRPPPPLASGVSDPGCPGAPFAFPTLPTPPPTQPKFQIISPDEDHNHNHETLTPPTPPTKVDSNSDRSLLHPLPSSPPPTPTLTTSTSTSTTRSSSYGAIYSRATSPTPGLWNVLDSREVAVEPRLGPWVGYWNRGSLQEVMEGLRGL